MRMRRMRAIPTVALLAAAAAAAPTSTEAQEAYPCTWRDAGAELTQRASPPDSARATLGTGFAKVCYGAPSVRGRTMLGGHVPFGQLWRLGANEATRLYLSVPASIGDVEVDAGAYSLYAIPGAETWEIFVSRSTDHWGNRINAQVRDQEVGSITVTPQALDTHVERMELRLEPAGASRTDLLLEWEQTRVRVPIEVTGEG